MSQRVLVYGLAVVGLAYFGLEHVGGRVESLRTINVSVPSSPSDGLSVQQFYPVLAENTFDQGSGSTADINDAFFTEPPEPEVQIVDVPLMEPEEVEEIAVPEPEPIDPINFLAKQGARFRLQATMPEQAAAIINGWAYQEGDRLPSTISATYVDEHGVNQTTSLEMWVHRVSRGEVHLTGKIAEGWQQSLVLKI